MKKEMLVFKVFFICAVLTFSAASARAEAVSISQAWIDWTSVSISGDIRWVDKSSGSGAVAEDVTGLYEDFQEEVEWVDTNAFASAFPTYGDAYTNDDYLYEKGYAIANEATTPWARSYTLAGRWGNFTAVSNGLVEISVDYRLSLELRTDYLGELAYGLAKVELLLGKGPLEGDGDMEKLENSVSDGASIPDYEQAGTLTVAYWFDAEDEGSVSFLVGDMVLNTAEVVGGTIPEPATIALFGLGALGLLRSSRRSASRSRTENAEHKLIVGTSNTQGLRGYLSSQPFLLCSKALFGGYFHLITVNRCIFP